MIDLGVCGPGGFAPCERCPIKSKLLEQNLLDICQENVQQQ